LRSWKTRAWGTVQPLLIAAGRVGADRRALPDFLIVGAQRSGTTSLHEWLGAHPAVRFPRLGKGVHYFDTAADRDLTWYRSHFPTRASLARAARRTGVDRIRVGEGSPYYLFHPAVPARVERALPAVQLIAILRDPVARAWSHYLHERRRGFEDLDFVEALDAEAARLATVTPSDLERPGFVSAEHQHHGYAARGRYAEQLERWFAVTGRDRWCVVFDRELYAADGAGQKRVREFLSLPDVGAFEFPRSNATKSEPMPEAGRARLIAMLAGEGERVATLLGRDPGWSV
jgi:hypothetical protein